MKRGVWGLILITLAVIGSGCATGSVQTARTNGEGNFQFGIEPGVIGAAGGGGLGVLPSFNLAGRYGVSDRVDIGARIGSVGYDVQAKIMLTDPSDQTSLAMSLAPQVEAIGYGGSGGGAFLMRSVIPLLIGIPVGDSEFTVAPRVSPWFFGAGAGGSSAGGLALFVGAEAGYAARLGKKFWLMPHVTLDYPLLAAAAGGGSSGVGTFGNGVLFGAGLGLLFGGRDAAGAAAPSAAPPVQ